MKLIEEKHVNQIVDLWNKNLPEQFAVTEKIIRDKIFDDPDFYLEGSFELMINDQVKGIIVSKVNNIGLSEYGDCAWISVLLVDSEMHNRGLGSKLLAKVEEKLKGIGIKKMILGGEFNNFFSGIPDPTPEKKSFFHNRGYIVNFEDHFDLMADVSKIEFDQLGVKMDTSDNFSTVVYKEEYFEKLMDFFDNSFPGRWKFEAVNYLEAGSPLENILIMLHRDQIIGFCRVFKSETITDNTAFLGQNYGSLGPIGISEEYRGKGIGNRILYDSFQILKARGTENVLIDWTVLKDFYGQFGFVPLRTYRAAYKVI